MFDFAWSEIALIAGVALVVIGPKDLPVALRAVSGFVKKARRMASEFQTHVDEMMRETDLKGVRDSFNEIRNFDLRSTVEKAVDPDHAIRNTFADDPLSPAVSEAAPDEHVPEPREPEPALPARVAAPAFVPPSLVPYVDPPGETVFVPPPFIPTGAMLQRPPS